MAESHLPALLRPTNSLVTPMLTDLYQITMAYAHWKNNRHEDPAIFECFFRKNPFRGEYTIFAGLDECLKHLVSFKFSESDIAYLKIVPSLSHCDPAFFDWMLQLDTSDVSVRAIPDGTGKPVFGFGCPFYFMSVSSLNLYRLYTVSGVSSRPTHDH